MALPLTFPSTQARPYLAPRPLPKVTSSTMNSGGSSTRATGGSGPSGKHRSEQDVLQLAERLCGHTKSLAQLNTPNKEGDTFLHVAARGGYVRVVEYLLEHAGRYLNLDQTSSTNDFTAIAYAARGGSADIVELLATAGADVSIFEKSDRNRFLPASAVERTKIWNALQAGSIAYSNKLYPTLLNLAPPFHELPQDLIPIIVDYIICPTRF